MDVARKNKRSILPDVCDIVLDALKCMDAKRQRRDTEARVQILIMEVTEAFWSLDLGRQEMGFFVVRLRGVFDIYRRVAQGSRGAPLAWCRFFSLIARLTHSMFDDARLRMEAYVDAPALTIAGCAREPRRMAAIVLLT